MYLRGRRRSCDQWARCRRFARRSRFLRTASASRTLRPPLPQPTRFSNAYSFGPIRYHICFSTCVATILCLMTPSPSRCPWFWIRCSGSVLICSALLPLYEYRGESSKRLEELCAGAPSTSSGSEERGALRRHWDELFRGLEAAAWYDRPAFEFNDLFLTVLFLYESFLFHIL